MKKIILISGIIMMLGLGCFSIVTVKSDSQTVIETKDKKPSTKNEIKFKTKFADDGALTYGTMYYRELFPNNKIGVGAEYTDYKDKEGKKAVIVEYSIKF